MKPLGDRAVRFALPAGVDRRALFAALRAIAPDVVLTESTGAVVSRDTEAIARAIAASCTHSDPGSENVHHARITEVPVSYDGEDLAAVAEAAGVAVDDVVRMHGEREVTVAMVGFLPGFAYLRGVDPRLAVPRRSPRPRVPKRSVAIAAGYTAVYPFASPGGWHLIGRTSWSPFDGDGAKLALGDRVRFVAVTELPPEPRAPARVSPPNAALRIQAIRGPALLVDGGRIGHAHEGVPESSPLAPRAMARANVALGNAVGACAIEAHTDVEVAALAPVALADDTGRVTTLAAGATHRLVKDRARRVAYLAIEGGFDVPVVLGSRSTLLVAGLGGHEGRLLARGDELARGHDARAGSANDAIDPSPPNGTIAIVEGPDRVDGAMDALLASTFRIAAASDRTGTRLEGRPPPPTDPDPRRASTPMVLGAIELTPSGFVVLGPDHPTTGGYPVVAVVTTESIEDFGLLPLGSDVRFVDVVTRPTSP